MVCPSSVLVEMFVAGSLTERSVPELEAHLEACEECILRVAVAAADLSANDRSQRSALTSSGSPLRQLFESRTRTETTLPQAAGSGPVLKRHAFGPYVVSGLLGVGGMSIVYRARHESSGREVAIKAVKMPLVAAFLGMLRQEIEFLKTARHPGIISVLDYDLVAKDPWYAMELFEGPSLRHFNKRLWEDEPRVDQAAAPRRAAGGHLEEVLCLFSRLCDPVAFIHGAGMVHGDLKPSNIFLRSTQEPVLMDFGLASRARGMIGRDTLDVTGRIRGTLPYIAPETIRGQLPDARTDLYAVGCMLYESLVGRPPFTSSSGPRIIDMHLGTEPRPPSSEVLGIPGPLDELMLRLLAKKPQDRFGHAHALGTVMLEIADSLSTTNQRATVSPVVSEASMPLFRPPMVGRESELGLLIERVQSVARRTGGGGVVLVSGESGIGKTFLAAEVAQRATLAGVQVVTGECVAQTNPSHGVTDASTTPLQPFHRFFRMLSDRCHERGPAEVERLLGDRVDLLAAHMPGLLQFHGRDKERMPPPPLPALAARERIVSSVVDTLCAFAEEKGLLIALDDLQWADDLSMAVLNRLDETLLGKTPLIVLGTYRSDEVGEALRALAEKPSTIDLRLGRLARPETAAIVGGMLSMPSPPDGLVDFVHAHAEGVPFYAAEYLRAFVATGELVYRDGGWALKESDAASGVRLEVELPKTLQELVHARVDRLPASTVEVLEAAAVIGRRFSASMLGRMVARPSRDVASSLVAAVAAQVAEGDGFDGFAFVHDKIRESLYLRLSPERQRQLHRLAAAALEMDALTPPGRFGQIGQHYRNAGEITKAIDCFEKAAESALAMAANADAGRFLRDAIELEARLPAREPALRRARWLRQWGDALQGLGSMGESVTVLKASAVLLGRPFPRSAAAFVVKFTREVLRQVWHRLRPGGIVRPKGAQLAAANEEIVRVFDRMHQASFYLGKNADLVFSTTVSLNASERAAPTSSLAVAYTNAAMMAGVIPLPKLADRYFQLARAACQLVPDAASESWLLLMEGAYRTWHGRRQRAIECLDRALVLFAEAGSLRHGDEAACARVGIDVFGGFHVPALARLDSIDATARKRRDLQIQCWAGLQRMEAYILRGDLEAAQVALSETRPLFGSQARPEQIWATGFDAYLALMREDYDAAEALVTRAIELIRMGPPVHSYCVSAYDRVADVAVSLCRGEAPGPIRKFRRERARLACRILDQAKRVFPIVKPAAILHRGSMDLILGRVREEKVLQSWRQGCSVARSLVLPFHELRLCQAIRSQLRKANREGEAENKRIRELCELMQIGDLAGQAPTTAATPRTRNAYPPSGSDARDGAAIRS